MKKLLTIIALLIIVSSCDWLQEDEPLTYEDPIVIAAANTKLQRYMDIKLATCRNDMLVRAEMKVDSIMTELIKEYMQDTMYFPNIPVRPEFPEKLLPDSSLKLQPIIKLIPTKVDGQSTNDSIQINKDSLIEN